MWFRVNSEQKEQFLEFCHEISAPVKSFAVGNDLLMYVARDVVIDGPFEALNVNTPYVLSNRGITGLSTHMQIDDVSFSEDSFHCIAGPCAVESMTQLEAVADTLLTTGTQFLRAGAFKPRTSPYDFQGLGADGIALLADIKAQFNLKIVSELLDPQDIDTLYPVVDVIQVGSRNMHNTALLKTVGQLDKPVLLKRGFSATYTEFLLAAEYILSEGNARVMLCERGIRAFTDKTRNVLDLAGVAWLKQTTHLPVIVDPSHATGLSELVPAMAYAALVTGANGVMVETHPEPRASVSDARQAIDFQTYQNMVDKLKQYAVVDKREVNKCS